MGPMDEDAIVSTAFFSPGWIAANGGWIHSNNVLFYFMESPFFDRTSANQSVVTQNAGIPEREFAFLSTRKKFEHTLSMLVGLQYVVAYDPLESNVKVDGPSGPEPSEIWVIRKQYLHTADGKESDISIRGFYFIMNQTIYQAPSVANILNYRMLNTVLAMNNIFSTTSTLPVFSASHGHAYFKPTSKTLPSSTSATQQSKENTPLPEVGTRSAEKAVASTVKKPPNDSNAKTLYDALQMTMRYGKEYMDDMPISGEPGNFRFTKQKDHVPVAGQLRPLGNGQLNSSRPTTPLPTSRVASPLPAIQTDVPSTQTKKSAAKSPGVHDPMKPKRRKSKAANLVSDLSQ